MPTIEIAVCRATESDASAWAVLRDALWPGEMAAHRAAIASALAENDDNQLTLLARAGVAIVGLAEASLRRDHVNGCGPPPVAFLEGLFVAPAWRRRGIARRLAEEVSAWAMGRGVSEFASDAPIDNVESHAMHRALGFAETERVVFFRRAIA